MILDTTFLIDLLRNDKNTLEKAKKLDEDDVALFTTAISVFEIWQSIADIKNKSKLDRINYLLSNLGLFDFDVESAKIGGVLKTQLKDKGLEIDPEDCMIAGVCLKHDQTLLTRNVKHFSRIKELRIESY